MSSLLTVLPRASLATEPRAADGRRSRECRFRWWLLPDPSHDPRHHLVGDPLAGRPGGRYVNIPPRVFRKQRPPVGAVGANERQGGLRLHTDQPQRVASDDHLFVRGDDVDANRAIGHGDARRVGLVCCLVEADTEPGEPRAYACAHGRGVLANPGRKDETIEAAKDAGQRADLARDAKREIFERELRAWLRARE